MGNLRSKQLGGRTVSVSYDGLNRASYINDSAAANRTLGYDARGNVKFLGNQTMIYDLSDQPIILQGMITGNYVYDGALSGSEEVPLGCNMKRVKSTAGGDLIYNIYDASGALVYIDNVSANKKITYIDKLARVTQIGATTPVTTYLHMDHLGSAVSGTLQSGAINWTERYTPYGEKLTNPIANQDQASFTGHIDDKLTGLTYMQARYYEPIIGRFLSVDPVGFSPERPEMFGRYTYVGNDPVNGTDPTGTVGNNLAGNFPGEPQRTFVPQQLTPAQQAANRSLALDFVPVVGDIKGAKEFLQSPSILGGIAVVVGFVPVVGDIGGKVIKNSGKFFRGAKLGEVPSFTPKPNEFKVDPSTGFVKETHGVSVFDNPDNVSQNGFVPHQVDESSVPDTLQIQQRGQNPNHFEITPAPGADLTPEQFAKELECVQCIPQ